MQDGKEQIKLIAEDTDARNPKIPSHGKDAWSSGVEKFLKLKKLGENPPAIGDGPFRSPASKVIRDVKNLTHSSAGYANMLTEVGSAILERLQTDNEAKVNSALEVSGGHFKKGECWKKDLAEQCMLETLQERFKHSLQKCHGKDMNQRGAALSTAYFALSAHLGICKTLDTAWSQKLEGLATRTMKQAKSTLANIATSKLEYHVCDIWFSNASKPDKKDSLLKWSTEFDSAKPSPEGGREAWLHPKVRQLEEEMISYGKATAGESAKKKQ